MFYLKWRSLIAVIVFICFCKTYTLCLFFVMHEPHITRSMNKVIHWTSEVKKQYLRLFNEWVMWVVHTALIWRPFAYQITPVEPKGFRLLTYGDHQSTFNPLRTTSLYKVYRLILGKKYIFKCKKTLSIFLKAFLMDMVLYFYYFNHFSASLSIDVILWRLKSILALK